MEADLHRIIAIATLQVIAGIGVGHSKAAVNNLICSLTGKTIETCCCEEKNGKLYCPLADKTIESCCCHDSR